MVSSNLDLDAVRVRLDELKAELAHYEFVYSDLLSHGRTASIGKKKDIYRVSMDGKKHRERKVKNKLINFMKGYSTYMTVDEISEKSGFLVTSIRGILYKQNNGEFESATIPYTNGMKGWRLKDKSVIDGGVSTGDESP